MAIPVILLGQTSCQLKSGKLTVDGTSTLHDWTSEATEVSMTGQFTVSDGKLAEVKDVQVTVKVAGIKSTKGKIMDNKTWEAFNYEKYPSIVFKLNTLTVSGTSLKATGSLSMAGASKTIELTVQSKVLANGDIQLKGAHKMNMRDYKMDTPTAMIGAIKVGEEVTVKFDVLVTPNSK
jgi:polyisoprenoid-binding protein YceI